MRASLAIALIAPLAACGASASSRSPANSAQRGDDLNVPPMPSAERPSAHPLPAATGGSDGAHHPNDFVDHPDLIGKDIVVDVFEALWDADHSSGADEGEYSVDVVDVGPWRFKISPAESQMEREAGGLPSLPADLRPPIRVHGVVVPAKWGVRLVAHALEQLEFPTPTRVPDASVITSNPKTWHRRYVEVVDEWAGGFELSVIGKGGTWLDLYPSATLTCAPPPTPGGHGLGVTTHQVRVTGFVYTATGHYGHLGGANAKLVATTVTFIDPKRPECR
jgi:hypothetical protein